MQRGAKLATMWSQKGPDETEIAQKSLVRHFIGDVYTLDETQRKHAAVFEQFIVDNWSKCTDPTYIANLSQELEEALKEVNDSRGKVTTKLNSLLGQVKMPQPKSNEAPSVIKHFAGTIAGAAISPYVAPLVFILSLSSLLPIGVDAQQLTVHGGTPEGFKSICGGLSKCIQGWIGDSNGTLVAQFNRFIQGGEWGEISAPKAIEDCATTNFIGGIAIEALETKAADNMTLLAKCSEVSQNSLRGFRPGMTMTMPTEPGIPAAVCENMKEVFTADISKCMKSSAVAKWDGVITGSVIGGIIALCLIGAAGYFCCKKVESCHNNRNCC